MLPVYGEVGISERRTSMNGLLRRTYESRERIRWLLVGVLLLLVVVGAVDRIQEAMALPASTVQLDSVTFGWPTRSDTSQWLPS